MPVVSVIVPNYNHAPYLRQRLDSIFNQTYQDFEVIILDDCSTDNSKKIIEEYRNRPQVSHVVYNEKNSGSPFKQWAKGFSLAQGEYIWIAESDDWAELNFLEETVNRIKNNNVNLVFTNSFIITPEKQTTDIDIQEDRIFNGRKLLRQEMIFHNFILNASAVLFKKETLNYNNRHGKNTTALWGRNMSSGTASLENCKIFRYLRNNKIIPFFHRIDIVLTNLKWIDENRLNFDSTLCYNTARKHWRNEIYSESLSKIIRFFVFHLYYVLKFLHLR